jgi:hypothetical protein
MRTASLALVVLLAVLAVAALPVPVGADSGTISRDSAGPQSSGGNDPIGGPPTPRIYGLGQPLLFGAGVVLLIAAAALGIYTFMTARPIDH